MEQYFLHGNMSRMWDEVGDDSFQAGSLEAHVFTGEVAADALLLNEHDLETIWFGSHQQQLEHCQQHESS